MSIRPFAATATLTIAGLALYGATSSVPVELPGTAQSVPGSVITTSVDTPLPAAATWWLTDSQDDPDGASDDEGCADGACGVEPRQDHGDGDHDPSWCVMWGSCRGN